MFSSLKIEFDQQ